MAGGGRNAVLLAAAAMLGVSMPAAVAGAASRAAPLMSRAGLARGVDPSSTYNVLNGVSADSGTDAWAVGSYRNNTTRVADTLTEHWNGDAWSQVPSPSPGTSNVLSAVSASSPTDAWAVGYYRTKSGDTTLILRWNGSSWIQVPSPSPGGATGSELTGVSAISGTDAWAVGYSRTGGRYGTLVLHWNGTAWADVPSPDPGRTHNFLYSVSALSATDAWAVGIFLNNKTGIADTLTLRWNGTAWTHVPSPNPSAPPHGTMLFGVSAVSATDVWAAGVFGGLTTGAGEPFLLRWNGRAWRQGQSGAPSPGRVKQPPVYSFGLNAVSAVSATDAWAVGDGGEVAPKQTRTTTLTEHWNGKGWSGVRSPNQGPRNNFLNGVSAVSATDAWAVGNYRTKSGDGTLILHWNGKTWSIA